MYLSYLGPNALRIHLPSWNHPRPLACDSWRFLRLAPYLWDPGTIRSLGRCKIRESASYRKHLVTRCTFSKPHSTYLLQGWFHARSLTHHFLRRHVETDISESLIVRNQREVAVVFSHGDVFRSGLVQAELGFDVDVPLEMKEE